MRRYDGLRKEIQKIKAGAIGTARPYIAWLESFGDGYRLSIGFWDGKAGSGDKMPSTQFYKFDTSEEAEAFLIQFLNNNPPLEPFVLFTGESELED